MKFTWPRSVMPVDLDKAYDQQITATLGFRSEAPCYVYHWEEHPSRETLVGYGDQPFEVPMRAGHWRVECEKRAWVIPPQAMQTVFTESDETYTTLDRPAALSPEMAAISRMMRANEIERERTRLQMESMRSALVATTRNDLDEVDESTTDETDENTDDLRASPPDDEGHEDEQPATDPVDPPVRKPKARRPAAKKD